MTTTPDTLPKAPFVFAYPGTSEPILATNEGGKPRRVTFDEMSVVCDRCNDYPALAARLERAMGLLARYIEADSGIADALTSEAAALLAEHEKETRP